jgi:hypothetical protein
MCDISYFFVLFETDEIEPTQKNFMYETLCVLSSLTKNFCQEAEVGVIDDFTYSFSLST